MAMNDKIINSLTIEEVRVRFEQWRGKRQGKAAIPNELWSAAIALARKNGVNRTASELRLDGGKLKRLMVAAGVAPMKCAPASFVELIAPQANLDECMIELEGRRGKIRIQLKGSGTADLAELTRKFWDLAS
jgi:hypothetical protein